MPHWKSKLNLKDLLNPDADDAYAAKAGPEAARRVRLALPKFEESDRDVVEWAADDLENCDSLDEFNEALETIYNAADSSRVWIQ